MDTRSHYRQDRYTQQLGKLYGIPFLGCDHNISYYIFSCRMLYVYCVVIVMMRDAVRKGILKMLSHYDKYYAWCGENVVSSIFYRCYAMHFIVLFSYVVLWLFVMPYYGESQGLKGDMVSPRQDGILGHAYESPNQLITPKHNFSINFCSIGFESTN